MKQKVIGDRVLIQFTNIYETEVYEENGKKKKREVYKDFSKEGKILAKGEGLYADLLSKGDVVYAMPFGGVEVEGLSSKKYRVLCIPAGDVYLVV